MIPSSLLTTLKPRMLANLKFFHILLEEAIQKSKISLQALKPN